MNSKIVSQNLLASTDWTQSPNSGLTADCVSAFAAYRASLRAIRRRDNASVSETQSETWPTAPKEEWS
tara:strand:+ start:187 stop:390 length:204 start_codon:yes stop_codon:yes gene_type:complete